MESPEYIVVKNLCERDHTGLWDEPLNMISSLAFIVCAYLIMKYRDSRYEIRGKAIIDIHILTFLVCFIGVGSLFFHSLSTRWAELMDITPIIVFILVYFVSFLHRVVQCSKFSIVVSLLAFLGVTHFLVTNFPGAFNDSIAYLSTMGALSVMAIYLNIGRRPSARMYLVAALIGVISLFFRSVDVMACDIFPLGTHFIWHSLNAVLIYILMKQLIRNVDRRARMLRLANMHHA